jgi:hypothetical protein
MTAPGLTGGDAAVGDLFGSLFPTTYLVVIGIGLLAVVGATLLQRAVRSARDQHKVERHRDRVSRLEARLAQGSCADV